MRVKVIGGWSMQLVENWRTIIWRSATSWVATILSFLIGTLGQGAMVALGLIGFIPAGPLQWGAAVFIAFIAFGAPLIVARIVHQPKMAEKVKCEDSPGV